MAELKDANTNPWYVLMTLYGEQDGEEIDTVLADKNRKAWHAWNFRSRINEDIKDDATSCGIALSELKPKIEETDTIAALAQEQVIARCGPGSSLPR